MNRLAGLLAVTALGIVGALLLLLTSHAGEQARCRRLDPASQAFSIYGCGQ